MERRLRATKGKKTKNLCTTVEFPLNSVAIFALHADLLWGAHTSPFGNLNMIYNAKIIYHAAKKYIATIDHNQNKGISQKHRKSLINHCCCCCCSNDAQP